MNVFGDATPMKMLIYLFPVQSKFLRRLKSSKQIFQCFSTLVGYRWNRILAGLNCHLIQFANLSTFRPFLYAVPAVLSTYPFTWQVLIRTLWWVRGWRYSIMFHTGGSALRLKPLLFQMLTFVEAVSLSYFRDHETEIVSLSYTLLMRRDSLSW